MSNEFSWPRAAKHAGIAFVAALVIGSIIVGAGSDLDAYHQGQVAGKLAMWALMGALAVSYGVQTRSRRLLAVLAIAIVAMIAVAVFGFLGYARRHDAQLTWSERAPLIVSNDGAERRLRHQSLGFSLQLPNDFEPLQGDWVAKLSARPEAAGAAWGNPPAGRMLMVILTPLGSEKELRELLRVMRDTAEPGIASKYPGAATQVLGDDFTWTANRREAHRHIAIGAAHVRSDAFVGDYAGGRTLAVVVVTVSREGDSLAEIASTFRAH